MNAKYPLFGFLWVVGCSALIDVDADYDEGGFSENQAGTQGAGAATKEPSGASDTAAGGAGGETAAAGGAGAAISQAGTENEGDAGVIDGSGPEAGTAGDGGSTSEPSTCSAETRLCSADGAVGSCADGAQTCEDGEWSECSVSPAAEDTCEPGNDDNCNGVPNEGCSCAPGSTRLCEGALGNCAEGTQSCGDDGGYGPCSIQPEDEDSCEPGDDADCDGTPNGGCDCEDGDTQICTGPSQGLCNPGESTCTDGSFGPCEGRVNPAPRDCRSSEDNDCDGKPDDTLDDVCRCAPGDSEACDEHSGLDGNGICKAGSRTCLGTANNSTSSWGSCVGSVGPAAFNCGSSADNDCNGTPDDEECGGTTPACVDGECVECEGTRRHCVGNTPEICSNGSWVTQAPCSGDTPECDADTGLCICRDTDTICLDADTEGVCLDGNWEERPCRLGCDDDECRRDTIAEAGKVTCDIDTGLTCNAGNNSGCCLVTKTCGVPSNCALDGNDRWMVNECDLDSDCASNQVCCYLSNPGECGTECRPYDECDIVGPGITGYRLLVCDPDLDPCPDGRECRPGHALGDAIVLPYTIHTCEPPPE